MSAEDFISFARMELLNFHLKGYDPSKANDAQLADDWRLISAKYATMVAGGKTEFATIAELENFAVRLLEEILKRGKITFHPDQMKETSLDLLRHSLGELIKGGLYLVPPHGEFFYSGKKTAMVKSLNFKRCLDFNILCSNDFAYGFIRFKPPRQISLKEFSHLQTTHAITEEEREKWWPKASKLWYYELRDFILYEKPKSILLPRGTQVFIDEVEFLPKPGTRNQKLTTKDVLEQIDLPTRDKRLAWLSSRAQELPDFVWIPDFISITGSTIFADRPPHDLDVVARAERMDSLLGLKLDRVFREYFDRSPHLIPEPAGPNWPYLPLYDLVLRKKPQFEVVPINEPEFASHIYHQRAASEEVKRQAHQSLEEDKLKLFRFYLPMKPTRITLAGERQTVSRFVSYFSEPDDFPVLNSKKYDGMHILIFRDKDKVEVWSEDGSLLAPENFPSLIEELEGLRAENFIIEAELESWLGDIHQPREAVAAQMRSTEKEPDDNLIANVFTCTFLNGKDLHQESEATRQEALDSLGIAYSTTHIPDLSHKLNKVPNDLCHNQKELKESTERLRFLPASEGVVAKKANSVYFLDGDSREGWIKFHNNAVLRGKVIEALGTKTAGVWNYRYGILPGNYAFKPGDLAEVGDEELVEVGKTFSTNIECSRGDLIEIEFETFNLTHDQKTDYYAVSAWAPVFLSRLDSRGKPDDVDAAAEKALQEHILQEKEVTLEGEVIYLG